MLGDDVCGVIDIGDEGFQFSVFKRLGNPWCHLPRPHNFI